MEKLVIQLIGVFLRIFLRYWTNNGEDRKVLTENIVDIEHFAEKNGLTVFEAKKFKRAIEDFIDTISEDFIKKYGTQIDNEDRKEAILLQILEDIQKINVNENNVISLFNKQYELQTLIMKQSEAERAFWSLEEVGVYTNCIKYITQMGMDFISKLPDFSPIALKQIIQHQSEFQKDLQEILKGIHTIESLFNNTEIEFRRYESIYRTQVIDKYGKIELVGSKVNNSIITKYDITTAYVELNCIDDNSMKELKLSKVFEASNVVWIKGEAGAGKTTFLQWVAMCAAKGDNEAIRNIKNTIPIVIGLRNIEWPLNLYNVVNNITLQVGVHCPDKWIHELLTKKDVILLIDGLDEISREKRNDIYNYVEEFVEKYPHQKILLTARNSVRENINCSKSCYEIVPMKMERIKFFIEYWHKEILRRNASITYEEISNLQHNLIQRIAKSYALRELARNPLLCAMLCALNYVNKEQIPDNRMQLYEECCELLMDARDTRRKIDITIYDNIPKLDYLTKRRILEEIAYRMMKNGVSSEDKQSMVLFLENLLNNTNIISSSNKNYNIESILNFLIERCGIIREPEEGVIDFIHKTFMEFLTVDTILRNNDRDLLVNEARNINWRETIIMCFSKMGEKDIDYVLEKLVKKGKEEHDDRYFLIASLCVSNASFYKYQSPLKTEIDKKIEEMIPPSDEKIEEMADLGVYLLAFLKNSDKYTIEERYNCLKLLAVCREKEAIPIILTYIIRYYEAEDLRIYEYALGLLLHYQEEELEEYNVKSFLVESILEYINDDRLLICQNIFYILNNYSLSEEIIRQLKKVKKIYIKTQECNRGSYRKPEVDFGKYFKGCEEIGVGGDTTSFSILQYFENIKKLEIETDIHLGVLTFELKKLYNLESVKELQIETKHPEIYMINQISKNMKNLEILTIILNHPDIVIDEKVFCGFDKLKKVIFIVDEELEKELKKNENIIKGYNTNLKMCINCIE